MKHARKMGGERREVFIVAGAVRSCSQLRGLGHFRMRGFITVQNEADYKKWFDDQERQMTAAP